MRRCRTLVACCSTAISIILLFAGLTLVEPDAMGTTHFVAHQLLMVLEPGKDFNSFLDRAHFQNGEGRGTVNVKTGLATGSIAAAVIPSSVSNSRSALGTNSPLP